MLDEKKQNILLITLIVCIVIMTVKALTISGKHDREIGELRGEISLIRGNAKETFTPIKKYTDKKMKGRKDFERKAGDSLRETKESIQSLKKKLDNHWHEGMKRKVVFE